MKKCNKECFGNKNGLCMVLNELPEGKCRFQRTDITFEQQRKDAKAYIQKYSGINRP